MGLPAGLLNTFQNSKKVVFFGGAGVSVASGLPDFKTINETTAYKTEQLLRPEHVNTPDFKNFFERFMYYPEAVPNLAHQILAKWQIPIITQNIDGLHQKAGSTEVHELHGSIHQSICTACYKTTEQQSFTKCPACGGFLRPDITLYSEMAKREAIDRAVQLLDNADFVIVAGTALKVKPAMKLVQYAATDNLVLINKEETPLDHRFKWVIHGEISTNLFMIDTLQNQ